MLNVDFSELKKINNNVKGWIQVNGTNINKLSDLQYLVNYTFMIINII